MKAAAIIIVEICPGKLTMELRPLPSPPEAPATALEGFGAQLMGDAIQAAMEQIAIINKEGEMISGKVNDPSVEAAVRAAVLRHANPSAPPKRE